MSIPTTYAACLMLFSFNGTNGDSDFNTLKKERAANTYVGNGAVALSNALAYGAYATSLRIDAPTKYVTMSNSISTVTWLTLTSVDISVEAKIYITGAVTGDHALVSRWFPGNANSTWWFGLNSAGNLVFVYRTSGGVITTVATAGTVPTGQWVHVRATKMGDQLRLFINGVSDASGTISSSSTASSSYPPRIGAHHDGSASMVSCYINDVMISQNPCAGLLSDFTVEGIPAAPSVANDTVLALGYKQFAFGRAQIPNVYPAGIDYAQIFTVFPGEATAGNTTPATAPYSGTVLNEGVPAIRSLRAYRRDTGQLVSTTVSAADGSFTINLIPNLEHFVVCLDDAAEPVKNDLIKRKTIATP